MTPHEKTLDCQDCGCVLRVLSAGEAQMVAGRPYDFVFYCGKCGAARQREMLREQLSAR